MTIAGNRYLQEGFSTPRSIVVEEMREISSTDVEAGLCTIFSVQAVVGIATTGCAHVGIDYGRRQ